MPVAGGILVGGDSGGLIVGVVVTVAGQDTYAYLDPTRMYLLQHTGFNASGVADLNNVVFAITRGGTAGVPATPVDTDQGYDEGLNKYIAIANSGPFEIGPGATSMTFRPVGGAPVFSVYESAPHYEGW